LVYAPITHWVWAADGWLFKAGALDLLAVQLYISTQVLLV
jgi:hypothetical protein